MADPSTPVHNRERRFISGEHPAPTKPSGPSWFDDLETQDGAIFDALNKIAEDCGQHYTDVLLARGDGQSHLHGRAGLIPKDSKLPHREIPSELGLTDYFLKHLHASLGKLRSLDPNVQFELAGGSEREHGHDLLLELKVNDIRNASLHSIWVILQAKCLFKSGKAWKFELTKKESGMEYAQVQKMQMAVETMREAGKTAMAGFMIFGEKATIFAPLHEILMHIQSRREVKDSVFETAVAGFFQDHEVNGQLVFNESYHLGTRILREAATILRSRKTGIPDHGPAIASLADRLRRADLNSLGASTPRDRSHRHRRAYQNAYADSNSSSDEHNGISGRGYGASSRSDAQYYAGADENPYAPVSRR